MQYYFEVINSFLFLYEFALIFTNSLNIFYSRTSKSTKIINSLNILLFALELILVRFIDTYIIFIIRILNTMSISFIFYINLPERSENNRNVENNENNITRNDIDYAMYF